MPYLIAITRINIRSLILILTIFLLCNFISCKSGTRDLNRIAISSGVQGSGQMSSIPDIYLPSDTMLVLPEYPAPGETFRILVTGKKDVLKAQLIVTDPAGNLEARNSKSGTDLPYWRIDDFSGSPAGKYEVTLIVNKKVASKLEFNISQRKVSNPAGVVWKSVRKWDSSMESIYSVWINSLFYGCSEQTSWSSLHEVTRNKDQNFLYNYLSLGEDDPGGKYSVIMQPDCADNPFFMRAYFSWKMGLPFGYHLCDRGNLERSPKTGQWITNETLNNKSNPVEAFNNFLRKIKDGVHSGTARTALDDENSDYYPVPLEQGALRPGTVYADPYGHTLILIGRVEQTSDQPGILLAVDAQPDGTVGIKRFWKGNFLFNTSGVVGEPGFKAFRPISLFKGLPRPVQNKDLTTARGFIPFSLRQRKLEADAFYHTMERVINPKPLDPETAFLGLIQALHEQLLVRITSVANAETWFKLHPGAVIPMPSTASGLFQTGGQWEDFSTPNRDLRLLIAMDAVLGFPDQIIRSPEDYKISGSDSPEKVKKKLQSVFDQKVSGLSVSYTGSDGTVEKLTVGEILKRKESFEMAYNPNDGIEIRWGAPENSTERARCRRHAPVNQLEKMRSFRVWFTKRLHPPT